MDEQGRSLFFRFVDDYNKFSDDLDKLLANTPDTQERKTVLSERVDADMALATLLRKATFGRGLDEGLLVRHPSASDPKQVVRLPGFGQDALLARVDARIERWKASTMKSNSPSEDAPE